MNLNVNFRVYYFTQNKPQYEIIENFSLNHVNLEVVHSHAQLMDQLMLAPSDLFLLDPSTGGSDRVEFQDLMNQHLSFKKVIELNESGLSAQGTTQILQELTKLVDAQNHQSLQRLNTLKRDVGDGLVRELVQIFIGKKETYIQGFKKDLEARAFNQISFSAHNLKSTGANLGIYQLAVPSEYIEKNVSNCSENIIKIFITELESQYNHAEAFLLSYLMKSS